MWPTLTAHWHSIGNSPGPRWCFTCLVASLCCDSVPAASGCSPIRSDRSMSSWRCPTSTSRWTSSSAKASRATGRPCGRGENAISWFRIRTAICSNSAPPVLNVRRHTGRGAGAVSWAAGNRRASNSKGSATKRRPLLDSAPRLGRLLTGSSLPSTGFSTPIREGTRHAGSIDQAPRRSPSDRLPRPRGAASGPSRRGSGARLSAGLQQGDGHRQRRDRGRGR